MQGDNPEGEDWCITLVIKNPNTEKELIKNLYKEIYNFWEAFDIEEETYVKLKAKRNGFLGVPNVVALVHNEEYKKNSLKEFTEKLSKLIPKDILT